MKEDRKKQKLVALRTRLENGGAVNNRELKTWLGAEVYAGYLRECAQQTEMRKDIKVKPSQIVEYERLLSYALFAYSKADTASARGRSSSKKLFNAADPLFERALEYLQEIMAADPSLCLWFDRDTDWTEGSELGLDPASMPRVVTSRSTDNRRGGLLSLLQSKRELKIGAIDRALWALDESNQPLTDAEVAAKRERFKQFLEQF